MSQKMAAKPSGPPVNWPLIACHFAGLPLELALHDTRTFGIRSVSPRTLGAVLIMFGFVACHPNDDCRPLAYFMVAVILLSIIAYTLAMIRTWRGIKSHTRYNGRPYLTWILPFSEITVKRLEPFLGLMGGWIIHRFNQPLGSFVLASALALWIKVGLENFGSRARALDINDALVEQNMALESVRKMQRR